MELVLIDGSSHHLLLPLTYTKPVSRLRIGIFTFEERWKRIMGSSSKVFHSTLKYLSNKYPDESTSDQVYVLGCIVATDILLEEISRLRNNDVLIQGTVVLASRNKKAFENKLDEAQFNLKPIENPCRIIEKPHDIFYFNEEVLSSDYLLITKGRKSEKLDKNVAKTGLNIFVEEGAKIYGCHLNAEEGPIYIGKNAEVMEGCLIRGPFALCENSTLKMGAKIYGPTTIGPFCKVGGEVSNSVFTGYSNKAHDGFLGNSVIGEWCNLGADTNCSNLKNNYGEVKSWSYVADEYESTGKQFCGLVMGDHSKSSINTMFNTGTVVGVSSNVFDGGFPPKFIPSFSWGGENEWTEYDLPKAVETARKACERRHIEFNEKDEEIFTSIFNWSAKYRTN